jgi:hypothetical protein
MRWPSYGWWRQDPGECIVCGKPSCSCVGTTGTVIVVPSARYRAQAPVREPPAPPPKATTETFTTVSYRDSALRKRRG